MMACTFCDSTTVDVVYNGLYDDRHGYPGFFNLMMCAGCGHRFLDACFSGEELRALYTDYYPRSDFKVEDHRPAREERGFASWLDGVNCSPFRWVPKGVRVLDIGCGFGESLGYYESRDCDAYGVEADENILKVAERFGYKVHVGLFNPEIYEPEFFDYVTMAQVIEHMTDPVECLKGVARVLKAGGTLVLSMPNVAGWGARLFGKKWINWHAPYHLQFFSRRSMKIAASKAGLEVMERRTVTSSAWLFYQWLHLVTCPKPGEPSPFWSPGRKKFTFTQKAALALFLGLRRLRVNHLATRFFDGLGLGDNQLLFLKKNPTEGAGR